MLFQSLLGFLIRCNKGALLERDWAIHVSIPIGFSNPLQQGSSSMESGGSTEFQSLLGFLIRCNAVMASIGMHMGPNKFQSLLGFLIRCNKTNPNGLDARTRVFQSLLGFLIRCNTCGTIPATRTSDVSIPIGFSNPLQPSRRWPGTTPVSRFQSLLGFLIRCNIHRAFHTRW